MSRIGSSCSDVRLEVRRPESTIEFVPGQSVVEFQPRLRSGAEEVAVGLQTRGVVQRAGLDRNVLRIDVKFRQNRGATEGAEVPVDRLARIASARISCKRARHAQRGSIDIHVRHERRSTFPLAVAAVAEVHVVGRCREVVADGSAEASAVEFGVHGGDFRLGSTR
jgi:hypothetical protein